jgi:hypothetical protein
MLTLLLLFGRWIVAILWTEDDMIKFDSLLTFFSARLSRAN